MIAIITGDIINSREIDPKLWLKVLKDCLKSFGKEPVSWEIFRGDSFQLQIDHPEKAFMAAIYIKACIKTIKRLDVRMAIGIGSELHPADKITEANGEAYIYSGNRFESLKKEKQTLAIQTPDEELDKELNLYLKLILLVLNDWSISSAGLVKTIIENDKLSQQEIGTLLGIKQSSVSERYSRAAYAEILEINEQYSNKIKRLNSK